VVFEIVSKHFTQLLSYSLNLGAINFYLGAQLHEHVIVKMDTKVVIMNIIHSYTTVSGKGEERPICAKLITI
jgi:hypothetical protein